MPKSRNFVRIIETPDGSLKRSENGSGREIHGLSYARTSKPGEPERGSYYIIADGKRKHLSADLSTAVAIIEKRPTYWTPERTRLHETHVELEIAVQDLLSPREGMREVPTPEAQRRIERLLQVAQQPTSETAPPPPSDKRLSDCLTAWKEARQGEVSPEHIADVAAYFGAFVRCVKDLPVNHLTAEHFTAFRAWVNRHRTTTNGNTETIRRSAAWVQRNHKWVKHVLKFVRWSYPSWGLPDGVLDWASAYQVVGGRERYNPDRHNRKALPPTIFKRLVATAQAWAETPVTGDKSTQSGRAKRNIQLRKREEGLRALAIVNLAAQCGLGNVDIMRIRWDNLKTNHDIPHMDFPRKKTEDVTGEIARFTPLLPSTLRSLEALRALGNPSPLVFVAGRGAAYVKATFDHFVARLFEDAKATGWSFKHFRNIGPTVAKRAGLGNKRDEFLGHNERGTNKFYTDDVGPEYLTDVVDAIAATYFDGEKVTPHGLRIKRRRA